MKKRQFLAALLALTTAMSMAVPTFAADTETLPTTAAPLETQDADALAAYQLNVDASLQKPTLSVTLPAGTAVLVNPYRMEVDIGGGETTFDTVLSPEMAIENHSGCAIRVDVKGSIVTKQKLAAADYDTTTALSNVSGTVNGTDFSDSANPIYLAKDEKTYVDANGYVLTVKKTAEKKDKDGNVTTPTSYAVTAYTASKNIKVATAPMKDEDADKSNTLFMYVEGKKDGDAWAAAYDAKTTAGTKATDGSMITGAAMALTAKETSKTILYLGGGENGKVRVSGQASTNPTNPWTIVQETDKFETPFTFVVSAVANAKPAAPVLTAVAFGNTTVDDPTIAENKYSYDVIWYQCTTNDQITLGSAFTVDAAGVTPSIKVTVTGGCTYNEAQKRITATAAGTAKVEVTVTNKGVSNTYTFNITAKTETKPAP